MYSQSPFGQKGAAYGGVMGAGGTAGSPLLNGMLAWWKLDEVSGARAASVGGYTLTDVNTVDSAAKGGGAPAGMPSTVASFTSANSEQLTLAVGSGVLSPTLAGGFTISGWFNDSAAVNFPALLYREPSAGARYHYWIIEDAIGNAVVSVLSRSPTQAISTAALAYTSGSWNSIVVTLDPADGKLRTYINNGTPNVSAALSEEYDTISGTLRFGFAGANFYTGLMSSWGMWRRCISAAERTQVTAGTTASFYPFTS